MPCLFVQPLAENAIRHGLSRRSSGGSLVIAAEKVYDRIHVSVRDDGVGLPPGWKLETSSCARGVNATCNLVIMGVGILINYSLAVVAV